MVMTFLMISSLITVFVNTEMAAMLSVTMMTFLFFGYSSVSSAHCFSNMFMMDNCSFNLMFLTILIFSFIPILNIFLQFSNISLKNYIIFLLQHVLILIFIVNKSITFYMLFELSLIPIFLIIMGWGYQIERLSAGSAMLMYTITSSLPLLMIIIWLMTKLDQVFMPFLVSVHVTNITPLAILVMFTAGFLVKLPIYLGHLWLPKAHVEAPASGSMILAAILLKLGGYGLIRFSNLISSNLSSVVIISLALWGGVLSSLICLQSLDLKIVVAYSSVAHMAIVIGSLMSLSNIGLSGSLMMMMAHGVSSSGLFLCVGVMSKYSNSRSMLLNKSLIIKSPMMSAIWFMTLIVGMGIPPSLNFMSELTSVIAMSSDFSGNIIAAMLLIFFAGVYSLILYSVPSHSFNQVLTMTAKDFNLSEKLVAIMHPVWAFLLVLMINLIE